jgi:hypothetical protein
MPKQKNGSIKRYSYLTAAEAAVFWHKYKDDAGPSISFQDRLAVLQGKRVEVSQRGQGTTSREPKTLDGN